MSSTRLPLISPQNGLPIPDKKLAATHRLPINPNSLRNRSDCPTHRLAESMASSVLVVEMVLLLLLLVVLMVGWPRLASIPLNCSPPTRKTFSPSIHSIAGAHHRVNTINLPRLTSPSGLERARTAETVNQCWAGGVKGSRLIGGNGPAGMMQAVGRGHWLAVPGGMPFPQFAFFQLPFPPHSSAHPLRFSRCLVCERMVPQSRTENRARNTPKLFHNPTAIVCCFSGNKSSLKLNRS